MKKFISFLFSLYLFIFLTILTQIGGIVFILSSILSKRGEVSYKYKSTFLFIILYLFATFVLVPITAPIFGREKIKHTNKIQPTNYITVLLNRNYVRPKLNELLAETAKKLSNTPIEIHYLDANFPFINKFPLLPHLSHNDGKKIDLSLIYETADGKISNKQKSVSGYGAFEHPKSTEYNQIEKCFEKGYFQYDYPKYMTLGKINTNLNFSKKGTKLLIQSILQNSNLQKIFIEPHLKNRMLLKDSRVRYHGCRAVRHDDHIHVQIK